MTLARVAAGGVHHAHGHYYDLHRPDLLPDDDLFDALWLTGLVAIHPFADAPQVSTVSLTGAGEALCRLLLTSQVSH